MYLCLTLVFSLLFQNGFQCQVARQQARTSPCRLGVHLNHIIESVDANRLWNDVAKSIVVLNPNFNANRDFSISEKAVVMRGDFEKRYNLSASANIANVNYRKVNRKASFRVWDNTPIRNSNAVKGNLSRYFPGKNMSIVNEEQRQLPLWPYIRPQSYNRTTLVITKADNRSLGSHQLSAKQGGLLGNLLGLSLDLPVGLLHRIPLSSGDTSIDSSRDEGQGGSKRKPYLYSIVTLVAFCRLSFYCFWNLQFRPQDWRLLLRPMMPCFFGIMYRAYQLLNAIEEQSQLREEFISNRYEPLSNDVHDFARARTGLF